MDRITATRVFVAIAERGSLTAAAETLDMSRAMVSRYLAAMESWVGSRLLHRNTRRISLTTAGEHVLTQGRTLLALSDALVSPDHESDQPLRGLLRVACSQSLAQAMIAGLVSRFLAAHPEAAIDLQVAEKTVDLVEERIDLSIRITNSLDPNLISRPLGLCRSVICAAPAYLDRPGRPATPDDLAQHNCLTYTYFGRSLWHFSTAGETETAISVHGNLSANDSMTLLQATLAGSGISMQPWYAAAPYIERGALEPLLPQAEPRSLGIHALYTSREYQPALLREFLDFLVSAFAETGVA